MKPEIDQILSLSANQLMGVLSPLLPSGYPQGSAAILGIMMMLSAQEYERAAEIRASENADMRALFADAAPTIAERELKAELAKAAATSDISLKISALDAENFALRRVLIRLHVHAEERGMRELERRIWTLLKAAAERRLLRLA